MKNRLFTLGLVVVMILGMTTAVVAEENIPVVTFTEDKEFSYGDVKLDQFEGMLPGDTEVQKIEIKNEYKDEMDFFISQETIEEVKQANSASGGAFTYSLSVASDAEGTDSVSLLEKEIGGTNANGEAREAFTNIEDLNDYVYVAKLENGQSAYIFLSLYIDGEGNDNQKKDGDEKNENNLYGYSKFLSTLGFSFRAYDGNKVIVDEPEPTVIDRIIEVVKTNPFKGGDSTSKILYSILICGGITLIAFVFFARKKKGEEQENEKVSK